MFKIIVSFVLIFGLVNGDLKDFKDMDAFLLAQQRNDSLLEPPKELYQQILKELTTIRTTYPEVKDIHHIPGIEVGKIIVNKGIDLNKLNASSFGPIRVESIGEDRYLVSFTKPYNEHKLAQILLKEFGKVSENLKTTSSVGHIGQYSQIIRTDIFDDLMYFFDIGSDDCYDYKPFCKHQKIWKFTLKGNKWILDKNN